MAIYEKPSYERFEAKGKGNFFVRICYGFVEGTLKKDTSEMSVSEVIQAFLDANGLGSPSEFFSKKFRKPKVDENAPDLNDIQLRYGWEDRVTAELYDKYKAPGTLFGPFQIYKETEKAYLLIGYYEMHHIEREISVRFWVPKSAIKTPKDKERDRQFEEQREANFQKATDRYERLIALAKERRVKGVRVGLKKDTIINRLIANGVDKSEIDKIYSS